MRVQIVRLVSFPMSKARGLHLRIGSLIALGLLLVLLLAAPLWAAEAPDVAQRILWAPHLGLAARIEAANVLVGKGCSGTIISLEQRLVLTAYHCVEDKIRLEDREERMPDGTYKKLKRERKEDVTVGQVRYENWRIVGRTSYDTELIAWDERKDLALIRFRSTTLPFRTAATLPPSTFAERVLMPIVVIGNPLGEENTLTVGVVANTNRLVEMGSDRVPQRYIQLDAVIGPGSSGGAVYHAEQGVYFAMPAAGYRGVPIGFAIPWRVIAEFLTAHCWQELYDTQAVARETCLAAQREQARTAEPQGRGE